jgi:hypothetical protein
LSNSMLSHITDEAERTRYLEDKVRQLDRRKWESGADGEQKPARQRNRLRVTDS